MKKSHTKRSWLTTVIAVITALVILILIFPSITLDNWNKITFFSIGMLLVILCVIVAIDGKKGTLRDIFYSLSFWS